MPESAHAPLCERRDTDRFGPHGRPRVLGRRGRAEPRVMVREGWAVAGWHFSMAYAERLGPSIAALAGAFEEPWRWPSEQQRR
jgi:hypothetical protein